jgi:hypothetical protein
MAPNVKSPIRLVVRCLAEEKGGQWQAFSLEFGLAAQGNSFPEVKHKLDRMIRSYLYDALVGQDQEHAWELLSRRAHARVYLLYYFTSAAHAVRRCMEVKLFKEPMRLQPAPCP